MTPPPLYYLGQSARGTSVVSWPQNPSAEYWREEMPSFASRMKKKSKSWERVTPSSEGRCGACQEAHARCPPVEEAVQQRAAQKAILPANQFEGIFETLPESIIACDREEKILHINAAALTLFEAASASLCRGTDFQQYLQSYQRGDKQPPALALEPWLMSLFSEGEETTGQQEAIIALQEQAVPILADAGRITQVITSYLANALSYGPADQPVTVQLTVEDTVARVSVHDEGPSIAGEEQGRIWQRFSSSRELTGHHEPDPSLGWGLYLSRAFIERHHGSVGVQSDPGHGATFWFTLPIEASVEE